MNIHITTGQRPNRPFLLSIEDKSILLEGQTEFVSTQTSQFVNNYDCTCTQETYNAIVDKVGTLEAPALIATSSSPVYPDRLNVYIENGSLKLKS